MMDSVSVPSGMRVRLTTAALVLLLGACGSDEPQPTPRPCPDVACLERTLTGHTERVTAVAFSPDGASLATASVDRSVRLWNVADGALLHPLEGHSLPVLSLAYSPDGTLLASGSEDASARLWRPADGELVKTLTEARFGVSALAFSKDGASLLGASADHTVLVWDVASGRLELRLLAHSAPVNALVLAPDGARFATAGSYLDGSVRMWSFPGANPLWQDFGEVAVWSLAFSPDGATLAAGGSFGRVHLYAAADGTALGELSAGNELVEALAYAPDGRLLAASERENVRVFDTLKAASAGRSRSPRMAAGSPRVATIGPCACGGCSSPPAMAGCQLRAAPGGAYTGTRKVAE
jgi:WD40 repeat protein